MSSTSISVSTPRHRWSSRRSAARWQRPASRWSSPSTTCATRTTPTHGLARRAARASLLEHAAAVITLTPGAARGDLARAGTWRRRAPAPARRRLRTSWPAPRPFARRLRRRAAREEPAGEHGRASGRPCSRGRRRRRCRVRAYRSTSTTRSSSRAPTVMPLRSAQRCARLRPSTTPSSCASTTTSATTSCGTTCAALDVSVLPYRFGTHSGWLEACFDLGTAVVAPSCGFYAEQRPCTDLPPRRDGLDAELAGGRGPGAPTHTRRHCARMPGVGGASATCWPWRTRASYASLLEDARVRSRSSRPRASRSRSRSRAGSRPTCGRSPTGCAAAGTT